MMKRLDIDEGKQAVAASEGAMLFLRDRTSRPEVGLAAAAMLLAVFARMLKIDREDAHQLLDLHLGLVDTARAVGAAASERRS